MKIDEIKSSAELFLYKAKIDLKSAKYLWEGFRNDNLEIDMEIIIFHLQQCTEKLLKSLLSKERIRVSKIHDIQKLIVALEKNNIFFPSNIRRLESLSEFAIMGRYSIILDDIEDVESHFEILDNFIIFVKKAIK